MNQPPAIETFGLTKQFGARRAVDQLTLTVPQGAVYGFLGPHGAGKTTTIRLLLGLIRPSSGSARILGYDIASERRAVLPQISALVDSPAFYPYLSGRDNLVVLGYTSGVHNQHRINELLEQVHLLAHANTRVASYSPAMKQRLALAAALLDNPRLLFIDEPANQHDPAGAAELYTLIRQLGTQGHTIFLTSRRLHELEHICDMIAVIDQGRLIAQGLVPELLRQQHALLVEAEPLPILHAVAATLGLSAKRIGERLACIALTTERTPELIAALVHAGVHIYRVELQKQTLADHFLALTSQ